MQAQVGQDQVKVTHHSIGDVLLIRMWESKRGYELEVVDLQDKETSEESIIFEKVFIRG